MTKQTDKTGLHRRQFFKRLAGLSAAATVGFLTRGGYRAAAAAEAHEPPRAGNVQIDDGYHETAHIRRYYETARR